MEGNGDKSQRRLSGFASSEYWTPERRQAQREKVKRLNERGEFGGKQPGAGRPRKKTVAEYVAEEAAKKGDVIWRELYSMIQHKSPGIKLGAIDRINKMEADVQKNMRDDEREVARLGGKQLQEALLEELQEFLGIESSDKIPDAEVVDEQIEYPQLESDNGNGSHD